MASVGAWRRLGVALLVGGWLLQGGCTGALQREIEVLLRPEANPTLIRGSSLVDLFGPEILGLFQQ